MPFFRFSDHGCKDVKPSFWIEAPDANTANTLALDHGAHFGTRCCNFCALRWYEVYNDDAEPEPEPGDTVFYCKTFTGILTPEAAAEFIGKSVNITVEFTHAPR